MFKQCLLDKGRHEFFFFYLSLYSNIWFSTLVTAHTFCAPLDGPRKSRFLTVVPAKTEIYLRGQYNCEGKADLGKGYRNPKTKLGGTKHFSEITWQKFHTLFCILALDRNIVALPISFLDFNSPC